MNITITFESTTGWIGDVPMVLDDNDLASHIEEAYARIFHPADAVYATIRKTGTQYVCKFIRTRHDKWVHSRWLR